MSIVDCPLAAIATGASLSVETPSPNGFQVSILLSAQDATIYMEGVTIAVASLGAPRFSIPWSAPGDVEGPRICCQPSTELLSPRGYSEDLAEDDSSGSHLRDGFLSSPSV